MLNLLVYILEAKKEMLVGFSVSLLYITYYLVEVVKRPELVCGAGEFRRVLEERVPVLQARYWPTPWCVESRMQTVLGSVLRSLFLPPLEYQREVVTLSDGGQVALDWANTGQGQARGVLLVLPGLTGSVHADYVRCLAAAARDLRLDTVVYNNRGLGGLPLTTPRLYCALSHEDLAEVVRWVRERRGAAQPLLAVGVSLGGLILAHYLAAHGAAAAVDAALAVSAPLDVEAGAASMERGANRLLSRHMARNLRAAVRAHAALRADWAAVGAARSVREFDAAFTARHFGFSSAEEYYRAATLRDKLRRVRAPLLCLCAADDPFQPRAALPAEEAARSGRVALVVPHRGGHIGFLEGWWPAQEARSQYISRVARQYFSALLDRPDLLLSSSKQTAVS
ncbi:phospholipase ABHD3 isoform X1 [Bombyx mori]|uniref:AB hydrolase-1 domain-containing protein n=1 Tax=Bombyx mori TaxID=7091 RepID=A0A8R1WHK3_BOMMO|nr:phospholipase ABHD3 isoform X1 [Bombyx mori]